VCVVNYPVFHSLAQSHIICLLFRSHQRSNLSKVSSTIQKSFAFHKSKSVVHRSKSDVDEISACLQLALTDAVFDHNAFHRFESGDLKPRHFKSKAPPKLSETRNYRTKVVEGFQPCPPMDISDQTKSNLGKVSTRLARNQATNYTH
jgi:hypothetical protein